MDDLQRSLQWHICNETIVEEDLEDPYVDNKPMWKVTIQCSAESWGNHAVAFKAIAAQYAATTLSSKKMKGDERRIMEYELENVNDAEEFIERSMALSGFIGTFEAL